jgi:hypothetical protein
MKKTILAVVISAAMLLSLVPAVALAGNGNGAPNGNHINLNIIGVKNIKSADMTYDGGSDRSSIFVKLDGKTRIYLYDGGDIDDMDNWKDAFAVLDANGTDGRAELQLGNPDYDAYLIGGDMTGVDTVCDYQIVARALGKPDGYATMITCAELAGNEGLIALLGLTSNAFQKEVNNAIDDETGAYMSVEQVPAEITMREKGKSSFQDVTAYLTSIVFEIILYDEGGAVIDVEYVRVPIFDDMLENEYWYYENHGLKLLQVRIYPYETDITYADDPYLPD